MSVEPAGVEAELDGLADVAGGGAPKKSRLRRESEAFVGFGAVAGLGGGGLALGTSVVLGRTGGDGTSPNRSIGGGALGGGGTGRLDDEPLRSEDSLSNLTFCCTTFKGYNGLISLISICSISKTDHILISSVI